MQRTETARSTHVRSSAVDSPYLASSELSVVLDVGGDRGRAAQTCIFTVPDKPPVLGSSRQPQPVTPYTAESECPIAHKFTYACVSTGSSISLRTATHDHLGRQRRHGVCRPCDRPRSRSHSLQSSLPLGHHICLRSCSPRRWPRRTSPTQTVASPVVIVIS